MRTAHIGPVVLFAITLNLQSAVQLSAQEAINIIPSGNALTTGVNPRINLDRQGLQTPKPSPSLATSNRYTDPRPKRTQTEQSSLRPSKPPNKPNRKRPQGKAAQIEQEHSQSSRRTNNPSIVPRPDLLPIPTKPAEIAVTPANIELSQEKKLGAQLSESYCDAVKPSISEQLMSWQRTRLDKIKIEVEDRLKQLEQRKAEIEALERRQQDSNSRLTGNMVSILTKMRPDAAASQLTAMEESSAAALITKMDARTAGPILSEIPSAKAARLAELITGRSNASIR